jgi:hypothetical protein
MFAANWIVERVSHLTTFAVVYLHSPNTPSRYGAQLKHRDNLTFAFPLFLTKLTRFRQ